AAVITSALFVQRDTPEEDLKPEDYQQFKDIGAACLSGGDSEQLLKFVQDEENQVPSLPLTGLDENQAACLGLALSALQKQLSRLPVPYTRQQEEADEHGLCRCCVALPPFALQPVTPVDDTKTNDFMTVSVSFANSCMRSLKEPLLEAELNRDRKSTLWLFAVEIMDILPAIKESLSGLLFSSSLRKFSMMDASLSKEPLACLAYLLFVPLINIESFPAVFSPVFILQCNMEHINQLLSTKKESHLLKGLALFAKSLERVEDNSLPVGLLDLKSFYSAPQNLRQVLTDCPFQHLRESGLKVFQLFINKLDAEAKHKFFRLGQITNLKHHADFAYTQLNIHLSLCYFDFFYFCLGRVMESLNLLRYLLMQDKELNVSQEELCRIKDDYLKMLRVCISMSRAYYSAEMKALKEDQKLKAKEAKEHARSTRWLKSFTVKHDKATHMSPEVQYQVLQSALVTFDLMESLIVRIDEITEEKLH
uniref:Glomulin, FKBP associated protein b n=1 Tax=Fundulus heteroclitus TaxID=8078 RepID=A0A3Q2T5L2_FUNHE